MARCLPALLLFVGWMGLGDTAQASANFPSACRAWAQAHDPGEPTAACLRQLAELGQAGVRVEGFRDERRLVQERVECRRESLDRSCLQWSCAGPGGRELRRTGGPGCSCAEEQSTPRCLEERKLRVYEYLYHVSARAELHNPFSFPVAVEMAFGEGSRSSQLEPGATIELPAEFVVGPFQNPVSAETLRASLAQVEVLWLKNLGQKARDVARRQQLEAEARELAALEAAAQAEALEAESVERVREEQRSSHRIEALQGQRKAALVTGFAMLAVGGGIGSGVFAAGLVHQERAGDQPAQLRGAAAKITVGATVLSASVVVSAVAFTMAGRKSRALRRMGIAPQVGSKPGLVLFGRF